MYVHLSLLPQWKTYCPVFPMFSINTQNKNKKMALQASEEKKNIRVFQQGNGKISEFTTRSDLDLELV